MKRLFNIKFVVDERAELENSVSFINNEIHNNKFINERVIDLYPELQIIFKQSKRERAKTLLNFIKNYYQGNLEELNRSKEIIERQWDKAQVEFEERLSKYIKIKSNSFTCYLSIFSTNPILNDFKSFQLYHRTREEVLRIIAHEIIHLIYYQDKKLIPIDRMTWEIAELYVYFLLNEPEFKEIIGKEHGYEEHNHDIQKLKDAWQKTRFDPSAFFVSAKYILIKTN